MNKRMRMNGIVVGNKMEKTVVVEVSRKVAHPTYKKEIVRNTKIYAHIEEPVEIGTKVVIEESKPISKLKRWRVVEIIEKK